MISVKRLLAPIVAFLLVVGISLAQGPKKDIGTNVPLSPEMPTPPPNNNATNNKQAGPPQKQNLPRADTLSIDVNLVNVDVVVTDNDGNPVGGLTKDHFKVFDDNVPQTITNFSPSDAPLTVVIVLEFGQTFGAYHDNVIQHAAGFINSLRPDDWAALESYDLRTNILVDFTKNKNELFDGLRRLSMPMYRETCLYDAVYDTLTRMENVDGKKAIFLLSTGLDTISKHGYPDTLKKTEASDTVIYAVSLGGMARNMMEPSMGGEQSITFLQADNTLRSFAENTGGQAFYPKFITEYPSIYQTVSAQLRTQYSLGFVPTDRKTDGKFHKLRVEVGPTDLTHNGKPIKLKVRHKQGYYADKS